MDDEEDVKRILEVLECTKEEHAHDFEYEEFINYESSDMEENGGILNDGEDDDYLFCDLSHTDVSKLNTYDPRSSLKPEERVVIDSCNDQDLKNILLLNRTKNIQLIQLYKKLKDLLIECQKNIADKNKIIKAHSEANKGQTTSTGAWRLAAPYFKDRLLYCSPPNDDTLQKMSNKELTIYDLSPFLKWSSFECERLVRAVKLNYNINQQNIAKKEIEQESKNGDSKDTKEKLKELKKRMKALNDDDIAEIPPLNSNECIDWARVAEVFLKDKHSAFECKSIWHLYLHPHINKSTWTSSENTKLKELVKKHNYENWDTIAKELDTNRTGFTVCMNYYSKLHDRHKKGDFTYEEDARLLDLVYQYRMGSYIPWFKIVQHFKDRTRAQLHYRYTYYLSQSDRKKGKFTDAEDVLLMVLVDKFGKNFKKCCEYFPTRSMVQCKSRYNSNLQNSIKKGSFTVEEDEIIMKYVEKHGTRSWANLTEKLKRSRGQIRQRYYTIKQFLDGNPKLTLDTVPRRKHNLKLQEETFDFLRIVADQYRDSSTIPSLGEIQRLLKRMKKEKGIPDLDIEEQSEEDEQLPKHITRHKIADPISDGIDDMLTDFFSHSFKINSLKSISSINLTRAARDVATVLNILAADLDVPNNFDVDVRLDNLDVAILNRLFGENSETGSLRFNSTLKNNDITTLIPPNINNLVGLRSLLIKFSHYKSGEHQEMLNLIHGSKKQHSVGGVKSDIIDRLLALPSAIRKEVEKERKLFYKRFCSLFKWPAIMTLEGPCAQLQSICRSSNREMPLQVKRTYSRANRNSSSEAVVKRAKLPNPSDTLSAKPSKALPLKLTPVTNKSVIEDLLRNKNKKLFYFDKVRYGDITKTIIREVPLSTINKKSITDRSSNATKNFTVVNQLDSPATTSSRQTICEASGSSCESFQFNTKEGECVIIDADDSESIRSYGGTDSTVDDEEDLSKLNIFLSHEQQLQNPENEDLQDLKKLDIFLKNEKETGGDSSDESSSLG